MDDDPEPVHLAPLASLRTNDALPDNVIPCQLMLGNITKSFRCLIDTGCLQDNLADPTVKQWVTANREAIEEHQWKKATGPCIVCSPISRTCSECSSSTIELHFAFLNERVNNLETFPISLKFLDSLHSKRYDLIIGLRTIKEHNLLRKLATRFFSEPVEGGVVESDQLCALSPIEHDTRSPNLDYADAKRDAKPSAPGMTPYDAEDISGGLGFREPALSWDTDVKASTSDDDIPRKVYGSVAFKEQCFALLREFRDVFSRTIDSTPSRVTPMQLDVDYARWHQPANRLPPRMQSTFKEEETRRQVEKMLALGVIRTSQAPFYSQVHLVPKPNGKWRFTIDFRNLNDCCTHPGWPLPNIQAMLQRIGRKRPRLFCKFDMTEGYHQFPLDEQSRKATAFITPFGLFEFCRVVMGLSGSGSNFQERMSSEVLVGLLYLMLEVYLDDIPLYANNENELLKNLRATLARFRSHHILLNPDKVEIGMDKLEFVGHLLDSTGIHMTETKLDSIRNFPKPKLKRELKQFLGLANYFRDHVRDHSSLAHPLQQALEGYTAKHRTHRIKWTPELATSFERLKEAISNCQKLYFMDDGYPVITNGRIRLWDRSVS